MPNEEANKRARSRYRIDPEKYRAKRRKWYHANKEKANASTIKSRNRPEAIEKTRSYMTQRRLANREYAWQYKCKHPCVDCGERDPRCLDFDHVNGNKYRGVAVLVGKSGSINTLVAEMLKCEVRCSNCHRKRYVRKPYQSPLPMPLT